MNTKRPLLIIFGNFLVILFVLLSCGTAQKTAVSCPEFSIKNSRVTTDHKGIKNKVPTSYFRGTTRKRYVRLSGRNKGKDFDVFQTTPVQYDILYPGIESVSEWNRNEYQKGLLTSENFKTSALRRNIMTSQLINRIDVYRQRSNFFINHTSGCDTIILKSGSVLFVKVEETGQYEIKYSECTSLNGTVNSISRLDVSEIKYANGTHEVLTSADPSDFVLNNTALNKNKAAIKKAGSGRIPWFVWSFAGLFVLSGLLVFGLPGLLVAVIALGVLGLVFRGISRIRGKRHSDTPETKRSESGHIITDVVVVAGVVLGLLLLFFFLMYILGSLV